MSTVPPFPCPGNTAPSGPPTWAALRTPWPDVQALAATIATALTTQLAAPALHTLNELLEAYGRDVLPTKAPGTQDQYLGEAQDAEEPRP